jgi:3'-phosphoadenosine 5'-phosphosulfate sulfotransferase (PAPS reductase)/FAD synthetase
MAALALRGGAVKVSAERQRTLSGLDVLDSQIELSKRVIASVAGKSSAPLIVCYSGGKDSTVLLDLVNQVTGLYSALYMQLDIEFPENVDFVRVQCERLGSKLLVSTPDMYKGGYWERLAFLGYFPSIVRRWCMRDLKVRPAAKLLRSLYGKGGFYKLNAVRRYESSRRLHIYNPRDMVRADQDAAGDLCVYPLLLWRDQDVLDYLERNKLRVGVNPLYAKWGVQGCYHCPFYENAIYLRVLKCDPCFYDRFIEWERRLEKPSANGYTWLSDLKSQVLGGSACARPGYNGGVPRILAY